MDHDIRSREIIARAMAGEAMTDGAGGTADPCYWYGPYADVALAALEAAGLLVISTTSLVPLDQDNPRPEAYILNEHVLRLQRELELHRASRKVVGAALKDSDEPIREALRVILPEITENGEVTYPLEGHLDSFIGSLATLGYAISPIECR